MSEYLVRGAMLVCQCGSHPRRLNLPRCHGVYMMEKPIIRKDDCIVGKNIEYFGVCSGSTPPEGAETITLTPYDKNSSSSGKNAEGPKCTPQIIEKWRCTNEESKISGEETAVTIDSYLVCRCGGLIQPVSSGQEYED